MDLDETPAERDFRARARAFITEYGHGFGDRRQKMFVVDPDAEQAFVQQARAWQRVKFDHGWAGIVWSEDVGGRGGTAVENAIFREEEARGVSPWMTHSLGIDIAGPAIDRFGSTEQRLALLPAMLRGEAAWCQLFSEPSAGSDLGAVRTSATAVAGGWRVTGQKVWSSKAHFADHGFLVARTDWDRPKYEGITCFVLDMHAAGVDVRPIRQINGSSHFDEVFLTDVFVPDTDRIGEVDQGWGIALAMLAGERNLQGDVERETPFADLVELARRTGTLDVPAVRQDLARCATRLQILRYMRLRSWTAASRGVPPGPEASVTKLAVSDHATRNAELIMRMLGPSALDDAGDTSRWLQEYLDHFAQRIGGGTDQLQRNMIAERVLKLPRDLRVDKGKAFRDLPAQ
jgi:alkylation response protein AidB-like acyl-CoA dehydrogenase